MTKILIVLILAVVGLFMYTVILNNGWNDNAARNCQRQYGFNTGHIYDERLCSLPDGTIRALKEEL